MVGMVPFCRDVPALFGNLGWRETCASEGVLGGKRVRCQSAHFFEKLVFGSPHYAVWSPPNIVRSNDGESVGRSFRATPCRRERGAKAVGRVEAGGRNPF